MNQAIPHGNLRASLTAGAIYDLALGVFILTAGPGVFAALGSPLGEDRFLFQLTTLPLFLLPALYLSAAKAESVAPFRVPVLWARFGGGGLILLAVLTQHPPLGWIFALVGLADLVWALVHFILWRS